MKFHNNAYGNDNPEGLKAWRDVCAKAANSKEVVFKESRAEAKEKVFVVERIHREDPRTDAACHWTECTLEEALEVIRLDALVHPNHDHFLWRRKKSNKEEPAEAIEDCP